MDIGGLWRTELAWYEENRASIHMNGRLYDPVIGRFISADPIVPYPTDIQSFNSYSYTRNNPLMLTDPSGFTDDDGKLKQKDDGGAAAAGWTVIYSADSYGTYSTKYVDNGPNSLQIVGHFTPIIATSMSSALGGIGTTVGRYAGGVFGGFLSGVCDFLTAGGCVIGNPVLVTGGTIIGEVLGEKLGVLAAEALNNKGGTDKVDEKKTSRRPSKGVRDEADKAATDSNGNLICTWCGVDMTPEAGHDNTREHIHIDPWRDTKDSSRENITDACRTCNRGKGTKSSEDFIGLRKLIRKTLSIVIKKHMFVSMYLKVPSQCCWFVGPMRIGASYVERNIQTMPHITKLWE